MEELEVLIGDWTLSVDVDGKTVSSAGYTFEWSHDRAFLLHRGQAEIPEDAPQVWKDNAPRWVSVVIGRDDRSGRYGYLYADSRDVRRVYEMSFDGRDWRVWGRAGENFFQRFHGRLSEDASSIESRWERSPDGEAWELDFEATYRRVSD